ncbi:glycosyltransferase family 2 protein [Legionella bononiensis]|uniref:Glycosyltransferase family 2 protein n=1 Tax=Legionella bononiensis TaxID=2793102 RepID=A0ABS1W7Y7_9GAMM|nr:glycosyltransferase family 2 protein [Legionella bononiensis]MBL7480010.1 glycosyltransferase family 2 protein [Legionella bononiensis]MBL7525476.1 glycosyltransferase family 2 protein [Legionella bononiensis]MBL7561659.1 glycosyltransferase family 2 protein [Legionella bononiensis]
MHLQGTEITIGVIIINYNSSVYLRKTIKALEKQTYKPYQVIIFDNASIEQLPDDIEHSTLPLKIIKSPNNLGFATGNNKAIESLNSKVNWIALVNPDAYPHEDWLLEMVRAIEQNPQYSFWGSQLICEQEPHLLDGTGDIYHISGKAWRMNHRKPLSNAPKEIKELFSPCAAAALYRRDAFNAVQGFDDHYFCYYEDIDLAFRLWLSGYKGCYAPKAIVEHTGSATTKRHSDFYTYHGHRNLVWTYFKNMPFILILITLPLHIMLNILTLFLFMKRGQTATILKSKLDALKDLPRIWKQRKSIQKNRIISSIELLKILKKGLPW